MTLSLRIFLIKIYIFSFLFHQVMSISSLEISAVIAIIIFSLSFLHICQKGNISINKSDRSFFLLFIWIVISSIISSLLINVDGKDKNF